MITSHSARGHRWRAFGKVQYNLHYTLYSYTVTAEEIFRKLLLSTIGGFWSDKSPLAIATALLLCTASLVLHVYVQPFKSHKSNLLQVSREYR
jgi:hypothetical protein